MDHLRAKRAHQQRLLLCRLELDEAHDARGAAVVHELEAVHRTVGLAQVEHVARQRMQVLCVAQPLYHFGSHVETMLGRSSRNRYPKKREPAVVPRLQPDDGRINAQKIKATLAAVKHVASVPATIDFMPRATTSARRSGHIVPRPPIMMPRLPKLAKPQSA